MRNDTQISNDKLLRILNPGIDDSGLYTCWAQNELGSANRSYQLMVPGEYIYRNNTKIYILFIQIYI